MEHPSFLRARRAYGMPRSKSFRQRHLVFQKVSRCVEAATLLSRMSGPMSHMRHDKRAFVSDLQTRLLPIYSPVREISPPCIRPNSNRMNSLGHALYVSQLVEPYRRRVLDQNAIGTPV